jgi:hypothetical protein
MPADDARSESFFAEKATTEGRVACASTRSEQRAKAERLRGKVCRKQGVLGQNNHLILTITCYLMRNNKYGVPAGSTPRVMLPYLSV